MQNTFGKRLTDERKKRGLSQAELGSQVGASKRSVIDWEADAASPKADYLIRMSALGIDVNYILTGLAGPNVDEAQGRNPRSLMGSNVDAAQGLDRGALMGAAGAARMPMEDSQAVQDDEERLLKAYREADSAGRAAVLITAEGAAMLAKVSRKKGR